MELPDGYSEGFLFSIAGGKQLDIYATWEGVQPRKKWLFLKEPDFMLRKRILVAAIERINEKKV